MKRALALFVIAGCAPPPSGATLAMDFRRGGFWDAPFPSEDLRKGGRVDVAAFPNPDRVQLVERALALLDRATGFAQAGAIYFRADSPLDTASLPDAAGSLAPGAGLFVVPVDPAAPDFLVRRPVEAALLDDGGPLGAPHLLALLPVQGLPLAAGRRHAAVVTTRVRDGKGRPLAPSPAMIELLAGRRLPGLSDPAHAAYRDALAALGRGGVDPASIAALAVFTTGTPAADLSSVRDAALARPLPSLSQPRRAEVYDDYCVYTSSVAMPVYQAGQPPYAQRGGGWAFGADGKPLIDHTETARVVFTIPRRAMPQAGWPLVVFVRTGGGGDRPLVDRGASATHEFTAPIVPGSGPARDLARAGFAGVQVDGPLGGARNPEGADEQFLTFNVFNPTALRDNVRQAAVELALLAHVVAAASFSVGDCAGATPAARFDRAHLAVMGHSMGAWIAPLAMAVEPTYGAAVLSGAGGSYVANVMDKLKPTRVRPYLEILLGYQNRPLVAHDPGLTLLQWAAEPSDPQVHAALVGKRHVLMLQGIVDHYILPSIANALSLALGLDLAGASWDERNDELAALGQVPLSARLPLVGRAPIALPVSDNARGATAVVVQHPGDAIQDGHEAVFQTEPPKRQYRCFLASWLRGAPVVVGGAEEAPCP